MGKCPLGKRRLGKCRLGKCLLGKCRWENVGWENVPLGNCRLGKYRGTGMSTIILKWSHSPDLIIFRYSCFKIGQSEPHVAYKSLAYKKKRVVDDGKLLCAHKNFLSTYTSETHLARYPEDSESATR